MKDGKIIQLEDRVPKLKKAKRKKSNRRLILYVSILFLLVLFLIYFRSPLSNIADISVQGNHYMSKKEVLKVSGITYETSYFRVIPEQAQEKLEKQNEVKKATVKKLFPNKIMITIEEYKTTGYINKEEKLYPLLENGKILPALPSNALPIAAPLLLQFEKEDAIRELSAELTKLSPGIFRSISEIHFDPKPSDPLHFIMYMNEGYKVSATVQDFAKKMDAYPLIIKQIKQGSQAIIHLEVGAYIEYLDAGGKPHEN
ncbi:cell division protein FtsQ/DivIB [Ectobacillus panaciterrae]|uniref:cell division protein FtsQ/DivIB n=1 Tax=Ectobacillus panaciterrae TaxID=363872 RepID=UPI0003FC8A7A|nr:FtsQ-type POTRA domain-containing protein [Ectobacillus panaciterrae]